MNLMQDEFPQEYYIALEILNIVDAIILVMNRSGRIILFNDAAESMTGYTFKEVQYQYPWDLFILPEEVEQVKHVFSQLTAGNFPNKHTNFWLTKDKNTRLIDWSNTAIVDNNGDIAFIIATGIDVTEKNVAENKLKNHIDDLEKTVSERTAALTKSNTKLERLTRLDGLTKIFNRRYFDEVIEREFERGKRSNKPISLLICDVDYFKNYNDTYGHVAGDDCLIQISSIIKSFFNRASDFVARYGGEEFIVILPGTDMKNAFQLANKLIQEVQNYKLPHDSSPVSKVVTISAGIATRLPRELTSHTTLIQEADKALYLAKSNGRNQVQLHSEENNRLS